MRAREAEKVLKGKETKKENIEEALKAVKEEVRPITDVRSSAEYRKDMSYILSKKALKKILEMKSN